MSKSQAESQMPSYPNEAPHPVAGDPPGDRLRRPRRSRQPWLIGLGTLLILLGGIFGWRLWTSLQGGNDPAMMQGQQIPVRLETLETGTVSESSELVGNLESRNSVTLRPEIEGRISQIYVQPGDRVEAGTPLVQLSADEQQAELSSVLAAVNSARAIRSNARSEVEALQAERISAVAEVELQTEQLQRAQALAAEGAIPDQDLDTAERNRQTAVAELQALDRRIQGARSSLAEAEAGLEQAQANADVSAAQLQDRTIEAPFAGVVGDIPVKVGDVVATTDEVTSVTRSQALELRLAVPLNRRADLRTGLPVELLDSQGNAIDRGEISFVSAQVAPNAQSILAKATFANPGGELLDQQFVRTRVLWNQRPGILIPTTAVSRLGGQAFVFVVEPAPPAEGQAPAADQPPALIARQRPVQLGELQGNRYPVLEGLNPGESIVSTGVINLQDGASVVEAPPSQSGQGQPAS